MQTFTKRIKGLSAKNLVKKLPYRAIFMCVLCFLLSRVTLYGDIAPLGLSFMSATFSGCFNPWTSLFYVLGQISAGVGLVAYMRGLISLFLFTLVSRLVYKRLKNPRIWLPVLCGVCAAAASAISLVVSGPTAHQIITGAIYTVISSLGSVAFMLAVPAISFPERLRRMNTSTGISVLIFCACVICSFSDMTIGPVSVGTVICVLLCLCVAYKYNPATATVVGLFLGVASGLSLPDFTMTVCAFCFSTFFATLLSRIGKPWIVLSFLITSAFLFFYLDNSAYIINFYEAASAGVIFLLIPKALFEKIDVFAGRDTEAISAKQLSGKLESLSETFLSLSDIFSTLCKDEGDNSDASTFIKRTADKVCSDCPKRVFCYKSNAESTFGTLYHLFSVVSDKGRIERGDLPYDFLSTCENHEKLTDTMTHLYDLYRVELLWESRVAEGRSAICGQMKSISGVFEKLAQKSPVPLLEDKELSEEIFSRLTKRGVTVRDLSAGYDDNDRLEVTLSLAPCGGFHRCDNQLQELLSELTGRSLERCGLKNCDKCRLKYTETKPWRISVGQASAPVFEQSGDSSSIARLEDGRFVIALSDGMGTGGKAGEVSSAAVKLAVRLLSAGIDTNAAISLINSVLVNKSAEGPFATIDLVLIDMYDGTCEFVKNGAAAGFILHKNGEVDVIRTKTLPAGLIENIEVTTTKKDLTGGDMLILLTDGVLDADASVNKEARIIKLLSEFSGDDAQALASFLMKHTLSDCAGGIKDDMTIITAKCINEPIFGNTANKRRLQA